jgi:catechol 2,3-dioxygenase-like lactoylglutathione lyase family enzyme
MADWRPGGISAITLFVEDLEVAKDFYRAVFDLPVHYEDDASAVFAFGGTLVNLLRVSEAPGLVGPAPVGGSDEGVRFQLTITVDDVDEAAAAAVARGAVLLNGPTDRPWGIRTAAFRDPAGHVWELAH